MRYIKDNDEQLLVFHALGSDVRISILKELMLHGRMSMNELARSLNLSNGALTSHIRLLEAANLLRINQDASGHGNLKICEPHLEKILFAFGGGQVSRNEYSSHLRVGQYSRAQVYPTCGISTAHAIIGEVDDARYFTHQKRFEADILWFTKGYVEYMIPCVIPENARIEQIDVSAELSSEAPGSNADWPSDIHFYLNDNLLGVWTCPGDYADVPGLFTPNWWFSSWNQYGLLKTLSIRSNGTFIDGLKLSDISIDSLRLDSRLPLYFRMEVPESARYVGGLTIFGRGFGNYNQDINFTIQYSS